MESTIFYPTGGGEPCDNGTISANGKIYNVIDVRKESDRVIHILDTETELQIGDEVHSSLIGIGDTPT